MQANAGPRQLCFLYVYQAIWEKYPTWFLFKIILHNKMSKKRFTQGQS